MRILARYGEYSEANRAEMLACNNAACWEHHRQELLDGRDALMEVQRRNASLEFSTDLNFAMSLATSFAREEFNHSFSEFRGATDPGLVLPRALDQLSEDFGANFYKDADGNIHVIRVAVDGINATLGLIPIGIDEAARGIAVNQFMVSAAGELIVIGQSDDPARQIAVSAAALSGGVAGATAASSICGGPETPAGWACGFVGGALSSRIMGDAAGYAYDFGWE